VCFELDQAPVFLPGQYVNIGVPGSGQTRSYSFSNRPGDTCASFLIKHVPGGLMSGWLAQAEVGDAVPMTGPLGSFYLREVTRPLLLFARSEKIAYLFSCTTSDGVVGLFEGHGFSVVGHDQVPKAKWDGYDPDRRARVKCLRFDP